MNLSDRLRRTHLRSKRQMLSLLLSVLILSPAVAQDLPFAFAWLSDTHVGNASGADDLRRTVSDLNEQDSLDFVVLSGDITEMGWQREFEETHEILSHLRVPYYIIPGNHDMKWSESAGQEFVRIFGTDRFVFRHKGFLFVGMHQGPVLRMGDGHFPPEDIRWLDSLAATIDPATRLLFVTHYPLDPSIDNWFEASNRLRRLNTQAVLVGHGHRDRILDFGGLPGVMGRSNLRGRQKSGGYTIVEVGRDSIRFFERTTGIRTNPQRHALAVGVHRYASSPERLPETPSRFPEGHERWRFSTGWTMTSSPAVSDGAVFVADRGGSVRKLDLETGEEKWTAQAGGPVLGNVHAGGGYVAGTSTNGMVFCLDASTGALRWSVRTGHANVASPVVLDGIVYTGSSNGLFLAIEAETGRELWRYDGLGGFVESRPLITGDRIVFGAWDSYLYCLDRTDGTLQWRWNNGTTSRLLSPAAVWPVASGDHLFIVAPDRAATTLDIRTGTEVWRSGAHQVRESAGISEDGSRFYAKTMNDTLLAYDARSAKEQVLWATDCGFGYDIANSMPQEKDGTVFFGTKNGLVHALRSGDGSVLWAYRFGNTIMNTVIPVDGRSVVVTNLDGDVALLQAPAGGRAE